MTEPFNLNTEQKRRLYGLALYIREMEELKKLQKEAKDLKAQRTAIENVTLTACESVNNENRKIPGHLVLSLVRLNRELDEMPIKIKKSEDEIKKFTGILNGQIVGGWGETDPFDSGGHNTVGCLILSIINGQNITEDMLFE